jgi:hypothetical protein
MSILTSPLYLEKARMATANLSGVTAEDTLLRHAIDTLGKDLEDTKRNGGNMAFAGHTSSGGKKDRKPKRSGHPPREEKQTGKDEQKMCKYCGKACPAMLGKGKEQCYAWNKKCETCKKTGHFSTVCRNKSAKKKFTASAANSEESTF